MNSGKRDRHAPKLEIPLLQPSSGLRTPTPGLAIKCV
jgi:hypothetical protein